MLDQFSRTQLLLGSNAMKKLSEARVAVFGIGGVGGHAVEALVRSGLGAIDLIDSDTIALTNLNRQIIATHSTLGQYKTEAAAERIRSINPNCTVRTHNIFYMPETAEMFDFTEYDHIVDAIDTVSGKIELIMNAKRCGTPIISSMGAGNKLNPEMLEVADIYKTSVCPLARVMRYELRKRGVDSLKVVYSKEKALPPAEAIPGMENDSVKKSVPGSNAFVPAVAGLIIAAEVVKDITGIRNNT